MFGHKNINFFDQSPQTVLNGLVCLAKLHFKLVKPLIINIKIILQRRGVLTVKYSVNKLITSHINNNNLFV